MKQNTSRQSWSQIQDQVLNSLVKKYGAGNWVLISEKMEARANTNYRSGKQCRQRWHNHLDPNVLKKQWSLDEQKIMFQAHRKYGNKWSQIAANFEGRTDNDIKNHFYSTLRKSLRRLNKMLGQKNSTQKIKKIRPSTLSKLFDDTQSAKSKETSEALFKFILQRQNINANNLSKKDRLVLETLTNQLQALSAIKDSQEPQEQCEKQQMVRVRQRKTRQRKPLQKIDSESPPEKKIMQQMRPKRIYRTQKTRKIKKQQKDQKKLLKSKLNKRNEKQNNFHQEQIVQQKVQILIGKRKSTTIGKQKKQPLVSDYFNQKLSGVQDENIFVRRMSLRKDNSYQERNMFAQMMLPETISVSRKSSSGLSEMKKLLSNTDFNSIYVTPRAPTPGYRQNLFQSWSIPQTWMTRQLIDEQTQKIRRQIQRNIQSTTN